MINPISFLWKQLNGPQISAICNAIWQYFKDSYDNLLDYFYNLSIASANDSHLTFIGLLQGLARPLTDIPSVKYITMGEEYGYIDDPDSPGHKIPDSQYPTPYGFSELGDEQSEVARGGRFPAEDGITEGKRYISSYVFRALLAGNAASKGALGSIVALDDMLYALWKKDHPESTQSKYLFTFSYTTDETASPGDIFVDLGRLTDWNYAEELQAEVKMLGKTIYYPIPRLIPKITV